MKSLEWAREASHAARARSSYLTLILEAYILLARPDDGIAVDYPAYLKANREKLHRYVALHVIG